MKLLIFVNFIFLIFSHNAFSLVKIFQHGNALMILGNKSIPDIEEFLTMKNDSPVIRIVISDGYCGIFYEHIAFKGTPTFIKDGASTFPKKRFKSMHFIKSDTCSEDANLLTYIHPNVKRNLTISFPIGFSSRSFEQLSVNSNVHRELRRYEDIRWFNLAKDSCLIWHNNDHGLFNSQSEIFTHKNNRRVYYFLVEHYGVNSFESLDIERCKYIQDKWENFF